MTLNTKAIIKAASVYSALAVLIGAAWAFGDNTGYRPWLKKEMQEFTARDFQMVMDQTQQNTLALAKSEFDRLWAQRKFGELSFEEKISLCKTAQILKYDLRTDDGSRECTEEGEPIFTFKSK